MPLWYLCVLRYCLKEEQAFRNKKIDLPGNSRGIAE